MFFIRANGGWGPLKIKKKTYENVKWELSSRKREIWVMPKTYQKLQKVDFTPPPFF